MENQQPQRPSPQGLPAPYGHACGNCVQAKCRCILRTEGNRCERCHRLNKACHPTVRVRQRNSKKSNTSKNTRLEEKLDDLVSLLRTGAQVGPRLNANAVSADSIPDPTTPQSSLRDSSASSTRDDLEPSPAEAKSYLDDFRTNKLQYFPFIHLPPSVTVQQLRQEFPLLWLVIIMISTKSPARVDVLAQRVYQIISQVMLRDGDKSMNLLLGILAHLWWANCFYKPSLCLFAQLATSLVFDLNLNRAPGSPPAISFFIYPQSNPKATSSRTMGERRAVLGCFVITSICSMFLQRTEPLRWTTHLGECLSHLEQNPECVNDHVLVQQVKFQLIIEKKNVSTWYEDLMAGSGRASIPSYSFLQALQSQLQLVKNQIPLEVQHNRIVLLHYHHAHLTLSDSALNSRWNNSSNQQTLTLPESNSLYSCLSSIQSWFGLFLTIPVIDYTAIPFSIYTQAVHSLVILFRISTLDTPGWDKSVVRRTIDVLETIDRLIHNLNQVSSLTTTGLLDSNTNTPSPPENLYSRTAKKFLSMRSLWESKLRSFDHPAPSSSSDDVAAAMSTAPPPPTATAVADVDEEEPGIPFPESDLLPDINDMDWLSDFFNLSSSNYNNNNANFNFLTGAGGNGSVRY